MCFTSLCDRFILFYDYYHYFKFISTLHHSHHTSLPCLRPPVSRERLVAMGTVQQRDHALNWVAKLVGITSQIRTLYIWLVLLLVLSLNFLFL